MSEPVLSTAVLHFSGNSVNSSLRRGGGNISMETICQKNREQSMVPGLNPNSLEKQLRICSKYILSYKKYCDCFHTLIKKYGNFMMNFSLLSYGEPGQTNNFSLPEEEMICCSQFCLCATQDIVIITYCLPNIKEMMKNWLEAPKTHIQKHQIVAVCAGAQRD